MALALVGLIAAQRTTLAATPATAPDAKAIDGLEGIALELFGRYSLPFQAVSVLLLATMVAVIVLAKRQRAGEHGEEPR